MSSMRVEVTEYGSGMSFLSTEKVVQPVDPGQPSQPS